MDTDTWTDWSCVVEVTTTPAALAPAVAIVRAVMAEVEAAASRFHSDSDLSRVNAAAGRFVRVRPLTLELLDVALQAARDTAGAVDPTVGAHLIAAGYDADIEVVRTRPAAAVCPQAPRLTSEVVRLDRVLSRVGVPMGVALDLGATAKAWAADEAAARAAARTGAPVLVGIGGDLAFVGTPDEGWRIDVAEARGDAVESVVASEGAMATSSILARRFRDSRGDQRHHLIDPRTGGAALSRWRTATVWAPTAVAANTISTWALVDDAAALAAVESRGLAARFVTHDGSVVLAGGWAADHSEVA